jgi:2-amino-4-hydroxy-6-hydroxymethyldihydropteridine diphosphokinase
MQIGLSLGSNIGNRCKTIIKAKIYITELPSVTFVNQSSIYKTEPVNMTDNCDNYFLNSILIIETTLPIYQFAQHIFEIENILGRPPKRLKNTSRKIDIDIIYANNLIIKESLTIPHPRCFNRKFVMQPLNEIMPDLKLPGQSLTVTEITKSLPEKPSVELFTQNW